MFLTGAIMGYRPGLLSVVACIGFMMAIGWCLSWLFAFVAMTAKSVSSASLYTVLIMFPLSFLSNAFVPTETMPSSAIRFFAEHINPVTKIVSAVRQMLGSGTIGADFWLAALGSLVILLIFVPLTIWRYGRSE